MDLLVRMGSNPIPGATLFIPVIIGDMFIRKLITIVTIIIVMV